MLLKIKNGGILINEFDATYTTKTVLELEEMEKDVCNLPLIFAEMFKDEVNSNDEERMYNGVKRVIKKYSEDKDAISIINEFTKVISGGASLEEILQVTKEEAVNPTLVSELTVDNSCTREH